jgi:hypothetical protein
VQLHVADMRRSDCVRAIPYLFVRLRVNWVVVAIAAGVGFAVFMCFLVVEQEVTFRWIAIAAVLAILVGLAAMLGGLLAHLACVAATAKKAGLLDSYTLTLREDGVHTQSVRGEARLNWASVALVKRSKNYIFIGVTPYTALIIPVRIFKSPEESEAFWVRARDLWRTSAQEA